MLSSLRVAPLPASDCSSCLSWFNCKNIWTSFQGRVRGKPGTNYSLAWFLLPPTLPALIILNQLVFLGNPHTCSCAVFVNEKDLCKHICWLLLKKFKLPRDHEYALQLGLVESEINYMLQGLQVTSQPRETINSAKELQIADDGYIAQKEIDTEDVCPICQDTLLKKMLPVTYCRCTDCSEYHLCHGCFRSFCHPSHNFAFREKRNQKWRSVEPAVKPSTSEQLHRVDAEQNSNEKEKVSCVPVQIMNSLPTMLVRKCSSLLDPGLQCRLCLKSFCIGQVTRFLPCEHKFHRNCIDHWLHKENACPIDGQTVYNPLTWEMVPRKDKANLLAPKAKNSPTKQTEQQLFIPGTGLLAKQMKPGHIAEKTQTSPQGYHNKNVPSECEQNLTLNGISYTSAGDSVPNLYSTQKARSLKFSRYVKGLVLIPKPDANVFMQKSVGTGLRGLSVYGNTG
uniref:E3 ubiquitin-protein ligase ZSWIM2 isoform X4 n=1 Tax=Pogona vitticeps TaxID=103695 RepID=A0ABM5EVZ1_9SAUR